MLYVERYWSYPFQRRLALLQKRIQCARVRQSPGHWEFCVPSPESTRVLSSWLEVSHPACGCFYSLLHCQASRKKTASNATSCRFKREAHESNSWAVTFSVYQLQVLSTMEAHLRKNRNQDGRNPQFATRLSMFCSPQSYESANSPFSMRFSWECGNRRSIRQ